MCEYLRLLPAAGRDPAFGVVYRPRRLAAGEEGCLLQQLAGETIHAALHACTRSMQFEPSDLAGTLQLHSPAVPSQGVSFIRLRVAKRW